VSLEEFIESTSGSEVRLKVERATAIRQGAPETADALFHLPLIALAIMVIARQTPFSTMALGRSVAMLLVERFYALRRRSAHLLETSITLRRRCAEALAFLEAASLVQVSQDRKRSVSLTPQGKTHLDRGGRESSDLGLLIRQLRTSQERVTARIGSNEY
jgi:hypothetical protein